MKKLLMGTTVAIFAAVTLTAGIASAAGGERGQRQCDRPEVTFDILDTDSSGGITGEEMTAKALEKFTEQDANGDGFLDASEILQAGKNRMGAHGNSDGEESSERAERRAERMENMAEHMIEHMIERRDENGDGMLSPDEMMPERAGDRFADADSDGNGEISEAEFDAAKENHGDRRGGKKGPRGQRGCDNS